MKTKDPLEKAYLIDIDRKAGYLLDSTKMQLTPSGQITILALMDSLNIDNSLILITT